MNLWQRVVGVTAGAVVALGLAVGGAAAGAPQTQAQYVSVVPGVTPRVFDGNTVTAAWTVKLDLQSFYRSPGSFYSGTVTGDFRVDGPGASVYTTLFSFPFGGADNPPWKVVDFDPIAWYAGSGAPVPGTYKLTVENIVISNPSLTPIPQHDVTSSIVLTAPPVVEPATPETVASSGDSSDVVAVATTRTQVRPGTWKTSAQAKVRVGQSRLVRLSLQHFTRGAWRTVVTLRANVVGRVTVKVHGSAGKWRWTANGVASKTFKLSA